MACDCTPFLFTANTAVAEVPTGGTIPLGSMVHQVCDRCQLNGNGVSCSGCGIYNVEANVTLAPASTTSDPVELSVQLMQDGVAVPGSKAIATSTGTVTLPVHAIVRNDTRVASTITLVVTGVGTSVGGCSVIIRPIS